MHINMCLQRSEKCASLQQAMSMVYMFTHHPRAGSLDVDASVELVQSEVLCSRSFFDNCLSVGPHETSLLKPTTDF